MNQSEEQETLNLTNYDKKTITNTSDDSLLNEFDNSITLNLTELSKETESEIKFIVPISRKTI